MGFKNHLGLVARVARYNLKIIFGGKFIWFLLAAFGFFAFFMFQRAWNRGEINEGYIYTLLLFPCLLLIFYPVFGIQTMKTTGSLRLSWIPTAKGVARLLMYGRTTSFWFFLPHRPCTALPGEPFPRWLPS